MKQWTDHMNSTGEGLHVHSFQSEPLFPTEEGHWPQTALGGGVADSHGFRLKWEQ